MPKLTIDGLDYHSEDLTENGKAQLLSLQFLEGQMLKLNHEIAIYQMAQKSYIQALKAEIANLGIQPLPSETSHE